MIKEENMEYQYREKLKNYLPDFMEALEERLDTDDKKWGDTWKHRPRDGQNDRLYLEFERYWDQYDYGHQDVPYLKMVGNLFICWVREYEREIARKSEEVYHVHFEED